MNKLKLFFNLSFVLVVILSCNNDDDNTPTIEIRDRAEQQIEDAALWQEYFATHYYNENFFNQVSDFKISDLIISKLGDDGIVPEGHVLLKNSDKLDSLSVIYEETDYKLYI